jgi:hypothetical protein
MSPPYDDLAEFQEPARETVAYRIGSEVHRHTTRLELLEERLNRALVEHETMNKEREQLCNQLPGITKKNSTTPSTSIDCWSSSSSPCSPRPAV